MAYYYIYILRSIKYPDRYYTGFTEDLDARVKEHNQGKCVHTSKHAPWELIAAIQFSDKRKANAFERYLKTGSGRAFTKRHFW